MKLFIGLFLIITFSISCSNPKKINNDNFVEPIIKATVSNNCTGKYIIINKLSYHVCNEDKLKKFKSGDNVIVTYQKIEKYTTQNGVVCEMYRESERWIKLISIK